MIEKFRERLRDVFSICSVRMNSKNDAKMLFTKLITNPKVAKSTSSKKMYSRIVFALTIYFCVTTSTFEITAETYPTLMLSKEEILELSLFKSQVEANLKELEIMELKLNKFRKTVEVQLGSKLNKELDKKLDLNFLTPPEPQVDWSRTRVIRKLEYSI